MALETTERAQTRDAWPSGGTAEDGSAPRLGADVDGAAVAHARALEALAAYRAGDYVTCRALARDAETLASGGHPREAGFAAQVEGLADMAEGRLASALGRFERAGDASRACGFDFGHVRALNLQAHVLHLLGRDVEARGRCELAHGIAAQALDRKGVAFCLDLEGRVRMRGGDLAAAERLFHDSLRLRRAIGDVGGMVFSHLDLAALELLAGALGPADEHAREALAGAAVIDSGPLLARARHTLARVAQAAGRTDEARELLAHVVLDASAEHEVRDEAARLLATALPEWRG